MELEILFWPESQDVMEDPEWFFIHGEELDKIGSSCYARILEETEDPNDNSQRRKKK